MIDLYLYTNLLLVEGVLTEAQVHAITNRMRTIEDDIARREKDFDEAFWEEETLG